MRQGDDCSCRATGCCNRQCQSFKVTVLLLYQVPPDVIVNNTPHAVMVYYYLVMCWALAGSGLQKRKPDPELRAGPGLGLVRLKPGLMSQRGNWLKYHIKIQFSRPEYTHGQPHNSTHCASCQVACAHNCWPTGSPKRVIYNIISNVILKSF